MRINDIVLNEMAISVAEGPVVWKKINDLLNKGDYKGAAEYFLEKGGNARGAKRTWNVAQANTKIVGDKVPGPIYGMIDKKHSYDKFMAAMPETEQKAKTNKPKRTEEKAEKDSESGATSAGYKEAAEVLLSKIRATKDNSNISWMTTDYIRAYGKLTGLSGTDAVAKIKARAKELQMTASDIVKYEALKKIPFADKSREQRAEFSRLDKATSKARNPLAISKKSKQDFEDANTAEELEAVLDRHIKDNVRIDNREMVVSLLEKIKKVTKGKKAVDLSLKLKQVFRNKDNSKSIDDLIAKYEKETGKGLKHLEGIDKMLTLFDSGKDIKRKDIEAFQKEVDKMLPIIKSEQKYDIKGFSTYTTASRKLKELLAEPGEPDIDDVDDIVTPMAKYHEGLKKDIKKERQKKKRNLKEDILYNLK
jgi:hypothetical protein